MTSKLIVVDAQQIVTPVSREGPQRGRKMSELQVLQNACLSIDSKSGKIEAVGSWKKVKSPKAKIIEAKNYVVLPGFVDSHSHPVYAGTRLEEFKLRAQGKTYMEVLAQGGGILQTVRDTRKAADLHLIRHTQTIFRQMLRHGTTTLEAKTGYGLSTKEELRQLRILQKLKKSSPLETFLTFLGAHAIPQEYTPRPDKYVELICREMLPQIAKQKLADFCDVFCDEGAFSVSDSRQILLAAKKLGFGLRVHADEFKSSGGTSLGVSLNALSVDHLKGILEDGVRALSESNTVATLLPCTSFFLGYEQYAPARKLIDSGAIVALATDFNAGSNMSFSMQMSASLGLLRMKMTPEEVVTASTLHGACALGAANRIGSLHPGKQADLILLPGEDYRELFYRFGTNQVEVTIKNGKVVHE